MPRENRKAKEIKVVYGPTKQEKWRRIASLG